MFKRKVVKFEIPDDARELTDEELFLVNGGSERRENSHEGVAGANVGDTIQRNDGTIVTLNQGDIDYARKQLGINGGGSGSSGGSSGSSGSGSGSGSSGGSSGSGSSGSSADTTPSVDLKKKAQADHKKNTELMDGWYGNSAISHIEKSKNQMLTGNKIEGETINGENAGNLTDRGYPSSMDPNPGIFVAKENEKDEIALSKIQESIKQNEDYKYNQNGNQFECDNWVEEVINDAGYDSTEYLLAGNSYKYACIKHIEEAKKADSGFTTTVPSLDGAYVVFMGDGTYHEGIKKGQHAPEHCGLLIINDGKMTVWDNSSCNSNGGVEPTSVYSLTETKLSAFTLYESFYFKRIQ